MENTTIETSVTNPPPAQEAKCYRCGKPVSELKPFGGAGDPLNGDFTGLKLVKTFRSMDEGCEIADDTRQLYDKICSEYKHVDGAAEDNIPELEKIYSKEVVDAAFFFDQIASTVGSSWECRDCIIL